MAELSPQELKQQYDRVTKAGRALQDAQIAQRTVTYRHEKHEDLHKRVHSAEYQAKVEAERAARIEKIVKMEEERRSSQAKEAAIRSNPQVMGERLRSK